MEQEQKPQPQTAENPSGEENVVTSISSKPEGASPEMQEESDKEQMAKEAQTERD